MTLPNVDNAVRRFQSVIARSWDLVQAAQQENDSYNLVEDWLQANWETLVEACLPAEQKILLQYYGEGAETSPPSGRIVWPDQVPTHEVFLRPSSGGALYDLISETEFPVSDEGVALGKFCTMLEGWYQEQPPFDCVLIEGSPERVVRADECYFFLREYHNHN